MIKKQSIFTNKAVHSIAPYLQRRLSISILTLLALIFSVIGVTPAYATTLVVMNTNDSGAGSLRQAIADAGVDDTITFDASLSGGTIYLASTLALTKNVTIDGSALVSKITLSGDTGNNGSKDVQILQVGTGVTAALNNLIITKGNAVNGGGGIYNNAGSTLTITNSTISDNSASYPAGGGGIFNNNGTLTVTNSTITGNYANYGGGIFNNSDGTLTVTNSIISNNSTLNFGGGIENYNALTITNSTVSGNSATYGGGIHNTTLQAAVVVAAISNSTISGNSAKYKGGGIQNAKPLTITNSTISGNSAPHGGGIENYDVLTITNSTISGNSANYGGGIENYAGTLNYINTIIANSTGGDCYNDAAIDTNLNNLVEDGSCFPSLSGDPNLGPRASNGGPTQTFALLTGSPAIDAGDDATCTNAPVNNLDQRGSTRPVGAHCDIGAYEGEVAPPPSVTLSSIAAQDGWVLESSETSSIGNSTNSTATTFRLGDDAARKQYRGILSFNTSSIPDTATIIGVTLKIKQQGIVGGGDPVTMFNGFIVDIKNGFFSSAALQITDFQTTASKMLGPIVLTPVNGVYSINLINGKTAINKLATNGGLTQIRLRLKLDDNNDAIANYLSLYSSNAGAAASRPQLVIVYTP